MSASPSQSPSAQDTVMSALWKFVSYLHPSLSTPPRPDHTHPVIKSGSLSITSGGLCWKFWKKHWFILTRTSLVFYESDPSSLSQQGDEVNQNLGGIELNNSGSVFVAEDQNLLTVLFPDGHGGHEFTLKAESSKDLHDWKKALEMALAQAPDAALVTGQRGTSQNKTDGRLKSHVKSLVVGMPIFPAREDTDGETSFLEKALIFLEMFGTKVEGILRQSADVEEVGRRVQEYEQGRNEFNSDEDAHVVGDCVKLVLRKLPSSPVPASCCAALVEAQRIEGKEARIIAMRFAIFKTLPEPNKRLLRRILKMMHTIASHVSENQMNSSAVAACMAPLLLCPLLHGKCQLDGGFDLNADDSAQLLAAANAANNAKAIVTTLVEEYENIFDKSSSGADSKNPKGQVLPSATGRRHFTRGLIEGSASPTDVDSGSIPSPPRTAEWMMEYKRSPSLKSWIEES